jgi:predicted ATPase
MLLVLDNYEHLLTGPEPDRRDGYGLVTRLAATAPQVKLLVTSRARLNVPQEWLAPLEGLATPPLSTPAADRGENLAVFLSGALIGAEPVEPAVAGPQPRDSGAMSAATLRRYSATTLFLECVRRVRPGFRPNAAEAHTIAHICRLLEGAPLAIELAAAWTRLLPLAEIARHLEQGLSLLTSSLRGVPPRQRSMMAAFDQSWRLLTPHERNFLRQLAVFRGGFTRAAAQAVAGADLTGLANLADASWLRMTAAGRCVLHELTRQYCADKLEHEHLAEAGETADQVRQRHAAYYQSALASLWEEFFRRHGAIPEITPDLGNLLAAWDWSLMHDDLATAWALSCGLGFLADRQGRNREMARVFDLGLARLRADHAAQRGGPVQQRDRAAFLAALLANQCERFSRIGQADDAQACLQEAERLLADDETDDAQWAEARWFCGRMAAWTGYERGDFAASVRLFQALRAEIQAHRVQIWPYSAGVGTIWLLETYELLGFNTQALGEYEETRRLAAEGVGIAEQQGLPYCRAWVSYPLIGALLSLGLYAQAEQAAQRFVSEARAFADDLMITQATAMLGHVQLATGQHDATRSTFQQAMAMAQRSGLRVIITSCLVGLGKLELALGHQAAAQRLYEQAFVAAQPGTNETWKPPAALVGLGRIALSQGRHEDALAHFRQALSAPVRSAATTAEALVYAAEALTQRGDLALPAEVCGFLLSWPGAPYGVKEIARRLVGALEGRMLPVELAMALGQQRQVEDAVAQLVDHAAASTARASSK